MAKIVLFLVLMLILIVLSGTVTATTHSNVSKVNYSHQQTDSHQLLTKKYPTSNIPYKKSVIHKVDPYLIQNLQSTLNPNYVVKTLPPSERESLPSLGTVKVPVFLVDFPDYPHKSTQNTTDAQLKLFGNGIKSDYPFESLRNYYSRSSYGQLSITGNVFGWYRTKYNRDHYTNNNDELIKEVLNHYNPSVDFSKYDSDGNGNLDAFYVYWTGPLSEWAGSWYGEQCWFNDPNYAVDGKKLKKYVWSWYADPGNGKFATITSIHETAHLLGLPDYYDYDMSKWPDAGANWPNGGIGAVDMMDGNADQNCFSKFLLGWIKPTIIRSGTHYITLKPSGNSKDAILIMPNTNGNIFNEFFMVQYRKKGVGNDPLTNDYNPNYPSDGIVIWHVDATLNGKGEFMYNNFNTPHKLLKLMESDGQEKIEYGFFADKNDFYTSGDSFGPNTFPNSNDNNGRYTGILLDKISTPGSSISARIVISNNPPQKTLSTALDNSLNWVTGGSSYWYVESSYTQDGVDAAQSGHLPKVSGYKPWSWIGTTIEGSGQLKFWWKISSRADKDQLRLYLKDDDKAATLVDEISGNVDWVQVTLNLGYGKHFLQWFYIKNDTLSTSGLDAGFLDKVEWIPSSIVLSDALDKPLQWDYNEIGWFGQNQVTHDGVDAAQTCSIPDGSNDLWVDLYTMVHGPGILKFWWKISSQNTYDCMELFDGDTFLGITNGNQADWQQKTFTLGSGDHLLHWAYYMKTSSSLDKAWIDQVEWTLTDITPPTASSNPGGSKYNADQYVKLSMNEDGIIYYTLNGANPTIYSDIYSNPLILSTSTTLKFLAVDLAGNLSPIYTQMYTIDKKAPTASATPPSGIYNTTKIVTLKMSEPGTIYYTLNGTTPTTSSTKYTKPLIIFSNKILKFFARDSVGNKSSIYTKTYKIDRIAPKVISTSPSNLKTGVLRSTIIIIKFREYVKSSINYKYIKVKNLRTNRYVAITKAISGNRLYIRTAKRSSNTWYRITIPVRSIKDYAGNNLKTTYTFRIKTGLK